MQVIAEMRGATVLTVSASGVIDETPIIGWAYVQGTFLNPLFAAPRRSGLGPNEGIRVTNDKGWSTVVMYDGQTVSEEEFESRMIALAEAGQIPEEATAVASAAPVPVPTETAPVRLDTSATYKTKSYWKMDVASAVFTIEPETPIPADSRCVKIKRDEFAALKREGYVAMAVSDIGKPGEGVVAEPPSENEIFDATHDLAGDDDNEGYDLI